MSMKHEIRYLPAAEQDIVDILEYIRRDNPSATVKLINEIDETISKLEDFPHMGVIPKDLRLRSLNYRMLIIDDYLVFYVVKDCIVEIRRILHGKRKYAFLL
ncbi:MAG: type II toxin-antitoxin system RelE/ParE family toxin [Firmicutes bacterium]|jgi:toxin ParE1/3/4|nr:type II toxin-antitoxin system RelE/ParE family toxin [Bacillota bacterium]HHX26309.1 type II toxin-antitoxin system RelE/ParE family toxin [Bacillota bacterium]